MYRNQIKKSVYFPVTTSLPYILIDYAIQHSKQQELIGALWYPLSIYDNAAATAVKYLDSRYLYHEVKTEICLMTITKIIVFEAFHVAKVCWPVQSETTLWAQTRTIRELIGAANCNCATTEPALLTWKASGCQRYVCQPSQWAFRVEHRRTIFNRPAIRSCWSYHAF